MNIDILAQISERFNALRDAEKKVATLIIKDIKNASQASITQLAIEASVSEATITRFAKAVGCKNVRDLKMQLGQSLAVGQRFIDESSDQDEPQDEKDIQGVYESIKHSMDLNRKVINNDDIQLAVNLLHNARQIISIGMGGGSTMISQEFQNRLFRLGYAITSYNDGLLTRMVASTADRNDVFIIISATGLTPEIVETALIAQQYGIKIISIAPENSPLAKMSDLTFPIINKENDFIYRPSTCRYAMLAIVDVISMKLAIAHKRRSRERLRRLKLALDVHRGGDNRQPLGD
jgi:RpiR family transcriptional regulator, carbohydrate utilization regulator